MDEERNSGVLDTVIVGAGLAGLTVAYGLRDRNILVLEKEDRPGGRTLSLEMGPYVYNAGAQVVLGDDSLTARLANEVGVKRTLIRKDQDPYAHQGETDSLSLRDPVLVEAAPANVGEDQAGVEAPEYQVAV